MPWAISPATIHTASLPLPETLCVEESPLNPMQTLEEVKVGGCSATVVQPAIDISSWRTQELFQMADDVLDALVIRMSAKSSGINASICKIIN